MSDLHTLLASVEKAEWPSRELGDAVLSALISVHASDAARWYGSGECLTESLNEVLSLAERMLPGWSWTISQGDWLFIDPPRPRARATLTEDAKSKGPYINATATTPALALIAALLRALIEKGTPMTELRQEIARVVYDMLKADMLSAWDYSEPIADALLPLISKAEQRGAWQSIKTAPRDRMILASDKDGVLAIVEWVGEGWSVCHDAEDYAWSGYKPTHWQTLPAPPLPTEEE